MTNFSRIVLDPKNSLRLTGWVAGFAALFSAVAAVAQLPEWGVATGAVLAVVMGLGVVFLGRR